MKAYLGKESITITGKVDLILSAMIIADHKTSATLEVWTQARSDHEVQPQMYMHLAKSNGIDVKGFQYNIVSPKGIKVLDVAYNEDRVQEILKYSFELKQALKQGNINYSTSKMTCNMCEFKSKCDRRRE